MRNIVAEVCRPWPGDLWVACSGQFTIERIAHPWGRPVHGNDVNAYTSALGLFLTGQKVPWHLKERAREQLGWMEPYLDDGVGTVAALMLGTNFLNDVGKDVIYYRRMVAGFERQFPRMHEQTVARLEGLRLRLASFYLGDCREYLKEVVPADGGVVSFPPFFCLAPDERILTSDLRWVPCGELREGDGLLAFDEYPADGQRCRRWRYGTVTRSEPAVAECVRVHLEDGTSVVCTSDHPWLANRYQGPSAKAEWIRADRLLERPWVVRLVDTWDQDRSYEAGWLAGIFDGEGSIHLNGSTPRSRERHLHRPPQGAGLRRLDHSAPLRLPADARHWRNAGCLAAARHGPA
jgi:hypothetical protein